MAYVLTVVLRSDVYVHSVHEEEADAKAEQTQLMNKLNNALGKAQEPFVSVGDEVIRLDDVVRMTVTTEDSAPGFGIGISFG